MNIQWLGLDAMPDCMRDGRELLLAIANTLGTAHGGDGALLHPKQPYLLYIASWNGREWETTESDCVDQTAVCLSANEPAFWAELNPPIPA